MGKIKVAVLGASGMIGQRFVQLLEDHPYFELNGLYASEKSAGMKFGEKVKLRDYSFKKETNDIVIKKMDVDDIAKNAEIVFSGLPSGFAGPLETKVAKKGIGVFTNASAHRMDKDVPILIPEVNASHIDSVKDQPTYKNGGFIITNANCSTTGIAVPLAALDDKYGLDQVFVSTYQALSGAGYPGVPSLDAVSNVVPYIGGEEEKIESELAKMLGSYSKKKFEYSDVDVYANCARVPVVDGHLESLTIKFCEKADAAKVAKTLESFTAEPQKLKLPTAPKKPIIVRKEQNRPQPVFDALAGEGRVKGMPVTVGRIREKGDFIKIYVLSHNTIRGGAGGSVLNAELAKAKKLI